jgi:putative hydrolase of the HAD superfamily
MFTAITFDWGDTLATNYSMPYLATQRAAFGRLAEDLAAAGAQPRADFVANAVAALAVEWHHSIDVARNREHREFDCPALFSRLIAEAGPADPAAVQVARERCEDRLADTIFPFPESIPTLTALKARGYRIGILSHVPWPGPACRRWFVRHGLAPYIDFYSLSCEVGWIKPNHHHYQDTARQAGCEPSKILHVGDHPLRDVRGGKAFGFATCLRRTERIYAEEDLDTCGPDIEILHLSELLTHLP